MNTKILSENLSRLAADENFNSYRLELINKVMNQLDRNSNIPEVIDHLFQSNYFNELTKLFKDLIHQDLVGLGPIGLFLNLNDWYVITQNGTQSLSITFLNSAQIELSLGLFTNRIPRGVYSLLEKQNKRLDELFPIITSINENHHYLVAISPAAAEVWIRVIQMSEFKKEWPAYNP